MTLGQNDDEEIREGEFPNEMIDSLAVSISSIRIRENDYIFKHLMAECDSGCCVIASGLVGGLSPEP